MANERVVSFKAIAEFGQVTREAERTEAALKRLKKAQTEFNASQGGNASSGNATAGQSKIQARALDDLSKSTKRYAAAKSALNKSNEESVKTPNENLSGRTSGYLALAGALKEVARQRKALNRANTEAVLAPEEHSAAEAASYLALAEAQKKAASAQRALNKARSGSAAVGGGSSGFDASSFVAGVRAFAEVKKASQEADSTLRTTNKTIRETDSVARRAAGGAGGFGRSIRNIRNEASGAGGGINNLKGALGELLPNWRRNELSAYRFGSVLRASAVPLVITGINLLASLLSPLAAGFIGLAGAIAPVVGLLGTLPGLLAGAAGGVGVLIAGFAGIGGALKAYSAQQKAATGNSIKAGKAAATHANQAVSSARAIKSAEQNVADAQKNVTAARKKARDEIDQMKKALKDLALQEEGESLSLEDARQRLQQVNDDPGSTDLERRQANLAVRQAQSSLDDVKNQQDKATKDLASANKKGVEGSDQVVQAKRAEKDAEASLAEAKRSGAAAQDSYNDSLAAGTTQSNAYADAMAKLTPEARAVVRQLIRMKPLIDAIRASAQRGLMPGVLSFLISSTKLFKPLNDFVKIAAKNFGNFFDQVGKALTTTSALDGWGKILKSTNKIISYFLEAAFNLGVVIANIAVAARPLTEWLVRSVRDWTRSWRAMTSGEEGQKRLTNFFKKTQSVAAQLGRIIGNVVGTVYNLGKGAQGTGKWILNAFERMTKSWKKFTGSVKGQNSIKKWAKDAQPALKQIAGLIGDAIKGVLDLGKKTDIASIIQQIRTQLLPAVLKVFGLFTGETASHIVSILANIGDAISTIAGVDGGGINTFFATLDSISGAIDSLVKNVPLARNAIALLIGLMATKAAFSFASSILGVSSAIKGVGTSVKVVRAVRKARSAEGLAAEQGAKRGLPSVGAAKKAAKAEAKDAKSQVKAAEKSGAKRGLTAAPVPGTKRGIAGKVEKGAKAVPKRALAAGAEDAEGGVKALGGLAKVLPKLKLLGPIAAFLPEIGEGLASIGPVGWIVIAALVQIALDIGAIFALSKRFPTEFAVVKGAFTAIGAGIVSVFSFIWRTIKFFFALFIQIFSVGFQIIKDIVYVAMDVIRVAIIGPFKLAFAWVRAKLAEFGAWIGKKFTEFINNVKGIWAAINIIIINPIRDALTKAYAKFKEANSILGAIIRGIIKTVIDYFNLQPTVDKVKGFLDRIHDNFEGMVTAIKATVALIKPIVSKAFAAIRKVVADPIGVVVGIINKGIIEPYLGLAKTFGIDTKVAPIDYKVPTFQSGGTIPGTKSNVHRDNVLGVSSKGRAVARVEPGEHIMPRNRSKWFGTLEHIRKFDSLPGYKNGGELFRKNRKLDSDFLVPPTEKQTRNLPSKIAGIKGNINDIVEKGPKRGSRGLGSPSSDAVGKGEGMIGDTGWLGRCLAFVNAAWNFQVGRFRLATAKQSQNAGPRTMGGKPPSGAGVYWDTGPYGHIALGVGDGSVVSTDAIKAGRIDRVPQTKLNAWGPYKGWWSPTGDKGGKGSLGGALSDLASNLPNPVTFIKSAYHKISDKLGDIGNSDFARVVRAVPQSLFDGFIANAKNLFKDGNTSDNSTNSDPTTMTSADRGKGSLASSKILSLVGSYARGTNSASRGHVLVGENGPEVIQTNGGERVINNNLTRRLPGYNKGGVVNGMKEGAKGDWVRALRSEVHAGTSPNWTSALSKVLRKGLTSVGTSSFSNYNKSDSYVNAIVKLLKKTKKDLSIDAIADALKTDPTNVYQDRNLVSAALKKANASKSDQSNFSKTASAFGSSRKKWIKALEKKDGESQDGDWGEDSDEPIQHMLYHAFKLPHDDYLAHPWKKNTAIEDAIMEQRRANKINNQFDGYLATFNDWGLASLVRKMNELGPADGLTLAKSLSGNKNAATLYDKDLAAAYARSDAASDSSNKDAQVNLLVSTVNAGKGTVGLQGASKALSLSLDSTAGIYDLAVSSGRLQRSSNSARLDKDVIDFRKLFKFSTGGDVPGHGNGDRIHALLEPGEFVMRKAASAAIERRFGAGTLDYLNNADRFSVGGFAGSMNPVSYRSSAVNFSRSGSSDTSNVASKSVVNNFNTVVNNPTLEDGAVSVQKRVVKIAQFGILG